LATFLMRSGLPTEVPPYFWTINDIKGVLNKALHSIRFHPLLQSLVTYFTLFGAGTLRADVLDQGSTI